jgi:hypothetical protein
MNYTNLSVETEVRGEEAVITLDSDDMTIAVIETDGSDIAIDKRSIETDSVIAAMAMFVMADELEDARLAEWSG